MCESVLNHPQGKSLIPLSLCPSQVYSLPSQPPPRLPLESSIHSRLWLCSLPPGALSSCNSPPGFQGTRQAKLGVAGHLVKKPQDLCARPQMLYFLDHSRVLGTVRIAL